MFIDKRLHIVEAHSKPIIWGAIIYFRFNYLWVFFYSLVINLVLMCFLSSSLAQPRSIINYLNCLLPTTNWVKETARGQFGWRKCCTKRPYAQEEKHMVNHKLHLQLLCIFFLDGSWGQPTDLIMKFKSVSRFHKNGIISSKSLK